MVTMTSFQAEKCCHLVNAHLGFAWHICSSIQQFLIVVFIFVFSLGLHYPLYYLPVYLFFSLSLPSGLVAREWKEDS